MSHPKNLVFPKSGSTHELFCPTVRVLLSILLSSTIALQQSFAFVSTPPEVKKVGEATQMADILGVKPEMDRLLHIAGDVEAGSTANAETVALKSKILQRTLVAYLQVRRACDKNDRELSYSYNVMRREQRRQDLVNELFTLANFAQLGTLYTMEPFLRLNSKFRASAICTSTSGGIGLILPVLSIAQQKTARAHHTTPPPVMQNLIDGGPVNASGLPPYVDRFLLSPSLVSNKTRKEEMFELWKIRYGVDASKTENLCSLIEDGKPKSLAMLNTRILLLWSLRTFLLDMDHSLLVLLQQVEATDVKRLESESGNDKSNESMSQSNHLKSLGLTTSAIDAARLLNIQKQVAELIDLGKNNRNSEAETQRRLRLENMISEQILSGALEVRVAADQVDAEINYASDVVLSELIAKRRKALQRNYEANFIQAGTFGSVAGLLYLKHLSHQGNEMFVISGGIGTALSVRALLLMRGGHRPIDTNPNSLLSVFNIPPADQYKFSPMITKFLNSPVPDAVDQTTRAQALLKYWNDEKITTVKLVNKKTLEGLAGAPPSEYDTINLVTNRISMLHGLLAHIELLDSELLGLARATDLLLPPLANPPANSTISANSAGFSNSLELTGSSAATLTQSALEAVNLLGLQTYINQLGNSGSDHSETHQALAESGEIATRITLTRKILLAALDVRTTSDILDSEISYEYDVLGRMVRSRDHVIAITNNINFFQLNVLSTIIDGELGESGNSRYVRASDVLNIVSGLSVGGLALLTVLEQRGGERPLPVHPNMVGQCLGLAPKNEYKFSPVVWQFINEPPPGSISGQTRVQLMKLSWKQTRSINVNMDKESTREKISAYGPAHTKHSETIKLLKNRLNMLFDVRGIIGLFDDDLDDLLKAVG
jgi:hypothetical protein